MRYILFVYSLLLCAHASSSTAHELTLETIPGHGCWVDPRVNQNRLENFRVTAWFEQQLLGDGLAYQRRMASLNDTGRRALRIDVRNVLKEANQLAIEKAGPALKALKASDVIQDVTYHWIVNGFTCTTDKNGVEAIIQIPGVRCLFFVGPVRKRNTPMIKNVQPEHEDETVPFQPNDVTPVWYIKALHADKAWRLYNATGKGVLNVIHDGNFVVSPTIRPTRYRNQHEQANGLDDDGNGLIDDLYGFDFDRKAGDLLRRGSDDINTIDRKLLHGHQCAAIICGRTAGTPARQFGIAPDARWAGVLAGQCFEEALEWAIEHDADTYSMSFSRANLGEYRSHWRKACEHASLCGVHLVSGAGNYAMEGSTQFKPVPIQMPIPQDIPFAVFAAAGVQRDLSRTPFSSQGPVEWKTHHYQDGRVKKPEVAAFNYRLPSIQPNGRILGQAASGNSFAGPMLCGAIALMLSIDPDLHPWETRQILIDTARDIADEGYDYQTGHGLIDAEKAVAIVVERLKSRAVDVE